jgi:flagellar hook-length control protein FliK
VYSVTSDVPTNVSFQGAPQRPARYDQPSGTDSFGTLLDSSTAAGAGNDSVTSTAQAQSAPQRGPNDASATADNTQPRDISSADQAASNNSDARAPTASQPSDANTDPAQRSGAKSGTSKASSAKPAEKSSSGKTSVTDSSTVPAASAQQGGSSATAPVAVAIPVTIASADAPAATPASGNATAPLAIAAAAIAASTSPAASAASSAQVKIDPDAAAAATTSAAATATTAASATTAKINVQTAASEAAAASANRQATQANPTVATDGALTAAVAATAPVAPKVTLLKAPVAAQATTAASGASGTSDPSATTTPADAAHNIVAQQSAAPGKQEAGNGIVDTAKADASADSSSISASAVSAHDHSPASGAGHALPDSPDTGVQATGAIQPQLPAPAATAAPVGPLSVTAATNAAVPLSGLAVEIAASVKSGKSSFEIRLDPADLGRIDVRIDVDRNGQVTSHLTVEKPETLSMLRQDAPQLQRQLDDAGFKTGSDGLQFSLRDQSSSGQNNGNETGRNSQRLVISDEDTIPASVAGRTYGRMLGSSSGVDIRV